MATVASSVDLLSTPIAMLGWLVPLVELAPVPMAILVLLPLTVPPSRAPATA
ncbi:hypothetical protein [Cupriavidus necator]|uniref:hypothetical protein n=1 Tax=Cupriavidus necator TaxID=106590 RepID=UPI001E38A79B|nr:hypothetical protein [Cupriavidus necator]